MNDPEGLAAASLCANKGPEILVRLIELDRQTVWLDRLHELVSWFPLLAFVIYCGIFTMRAFKNFSSPLIMPSLLDWALLYFLWGIAYKWYQRKTKLPSLGELPE